MGAGQRVFSLRPRDALLSLYRDRGQVSQNFATLVLDGTSRELDVRAIVGSAAAALLPGALLGMLRDAGSFLDAECARLLAIPGRGSQCEI